MKQKIKVPVLHIMNRKNGYIGSIELELEKIESLPVLHFLENPELYTSVAIALEFKDILIDVLYEKETPTA